MYVSSPESSPVQNPGPVQVIVLPMVDGPIDSTHLDRQLTPTAQLLAKITNPPYYGLAHNYSNG